MNCTIGQFLQEREVVGANVSGHHSCIRVFILTGDLRISFTICVLGKELASWQVCSAWPV